MAHDTCPGLDSVHRKCQSLGRGALLVEYVASMLIDRGMRTLHVETAGTSDFEQVRSSDRKKGLKNEGRMRDYDDSGLDKFIYRKQLISQVDSQHPVTVPGTLRTTPTHLRRSAR